MDSTTSMDTSNSTMSMQRMAMVFYTSLNTPLYSSSWTPDSSGTYAGTCIFLVILTIVLRFLTAWKAVLERRWSAKSHSWNLLATKHSAESEKMAKGGPQRQCQQLGFDAPFRLSIDIPRAILFTLLLGIAYLLMLAVMTMNIGYYLSILVGGFLGELLFGRVAASLMIADGHLH